VRHRQDLISIASSNFSINSLRYSTSLSKLELYLESSFSSSMSKLELELELESLSISKTFLYFVVVYGLCRWYRSWLRESLTDALFRWQSALHYMWHRGSFRAILPKVKELKALSKRSIEGNSGWRALSERGMGRMRTSRIVCSMPEDGPMVSARTALLNLYFKL
jgi:hypothetical protein